MSSHLVEELARARGSNSKDSVPGNKVTFLLVTLLYCLDFLK